MNHSRAYVVTEYHWARKSQNARETELQWRVKQNIVDTLISFIWFVASIYPITLSPDSGVQDLDTLGDSPLFIHVLHFDCW